MTMSPCEPEILAFCETCRNFYPDDAVGAPIEAQRAWYDELCERFDRPMPEGVATEDLRIAGIATRFYRPPEIKADATVLYLHGGGFVVGSLQSHNAIVAELAHGAAAEIVAVDYRLAPEHRHPAALDDAMAVLRALLGERRQIVLCGDSAGATMAAGLALRAERDGLAGIVGQALVYPALGGDMRRGSYLEMAEAPGLTTADVAYYRAMLAAPKDDPISHPLQAESLEALPPAYITAARFDPLRDDARRYAARLAEAGVDVVFREEPQMVHGWLRARHMSPGAAAAFAALTAGLARLAGG